MIAWFAGQSLALKIALGGLGFVLLSYFLWLLWLRKYLEWQNVKTLEIQERVGLKIEFIKTAAQILGGAFFLFGFYFTWQNLVVTQEKNRADLTMAKEKQITELYVKAIDQLGNDKQLEVRLGGIYALERIARDSDKDHGPIMEVLTAFVRLHAPWPPKKPAEGKEQPAKTKKSAPGEKMPETTPAPEFKPRTDVQAILTVLGRRARTYGNDETKGLDLQQTNLRGVDLLEAHLEGAVLEEAHLEGAILWKAHLEGAHLWGAHLEGASLLGANLERAHLKEAHLEGAHLWGANLKGADLTRADLTGADLTLADLTGASGLTQKQIDSVIKVDKDKLPEYLKKTGPNQAAPQ